MAAGGPASSWPTGGRALRSGRQPAAVEIRVPAFLADAFIFVGPAFLPALRLAFLLLGGRAGVEVPVQEIPHVSHLLPCSTSQRIWEAVKIRV